MYNWIWSFISFLALVLEIQCPQNFGEIHTDKHFLKMVKSCSGHLKICKFIENRKLKIFANPMTKSKDFCTILKHLLIFFILYKKLSSQSTYSIRNTEYINSIRAKIFFYSLNIDKGILTVFSTALYTCLKHVRTTNLPWNSVNLINDYICAISYRQLSFNHTFYAIKFPQTIL